MRAHHDALASTLGARIADWTVLAKTFGEGGLTDRYGNPPKPETARKTWQRVRKTAAAAGRAKTKTNPPPAQRQQPVVARAEPQPARPTDPTNPSQTTDDIRAKFARSGLPMPKPLIR